MFIDLKRNLISNDDVARSPASQQEKVSFILEMANLGYAVPLESVNTTWTELAKVLETTKKFVGADKNWTPFYPNFPKQVINASSAELFWNAIVHYAGTYLFNVSLRPDFPVELREQLEVIPEDLTELKSMPVADILVSRLSTLQNKVSLSASDFEDVEKAMVALGVFETLKVLKDLPFPNKENWVKTLELLGRLGVKKDAIQQIALDTSKTATDLLRSIFMLYSDSDVHINLTANKNEKIYLKSIPRPIRKEIVATIDERFSDYLDDFFIHRKLWKIVDRKIHPGDFSEFAKAMDAFAVVRGTVKYKTYNSRLQEALSDKNAVEVAKLLSQRPGVFARSLDHALRTFAGTEQFDIARAFEKVASDVSTTVLISLYNGLSNRNNAASVVRTKSGTTANVTNEKAEISTEVIEFVKETILTSLGRHFETKPSLGKVFVDETLKGFIAPTQVRTASSGRVLPRGSKIDIAEGNTLRFFVHWYNVEDSDYGRDYVDVDMDAIFLDSKLQVVDQVSYTRLRNSYATHSGDITNAPRPDGAAEYIDVNIGNALQHGVRYLVMNLNVYSGQKMSDVENFIGYMVRKGNAQKGEIFDPKTVKSAFTSTVPGRNATPGIFDLVERKFIWLDTSFGGAGVGFSAYSGSNEIAETIRLELDKEALSMYDVITANAEARGEIVENADEADIVFSTDTLDVFDVNGFINEFI